MQNPQEIKIVWFLLRFGVAFTFLFAAVSAFINPDPWLAYFPGFMRSMVADDILLLTWGVGEVIIGLWLISGWKIFLPSIAASGLLLGIFIFDFHSINITFRNVSILSTSIALAIMSNPFYHFKLVHTGEHIEEVHTENLPMVIEQ